MITNLIFCVFWVLIISLQCCLFFYIRQFVEIDELSLFGGNALKKCVVILFSVLKCIPFPLKNVLLFCDSGIMFHFYLIFLFNINSQVLKMDVTKWFAKIPFSYLWTLRIVFAVWTFHDLWYAVIISSVFLCIGLLKSVFFLSLLRILKSMFK